jgi:hypothetical protein
MHCFSSTCTKLCYFVDFFPLASSIYCYGGEYKAAGKADAILSDNWSLDVVNTFDLSNQIGKTYLKRRL